MGRTLDVRVLGLAATSDLALHLAVVRAWVYEVHPGDHALLALVDEALDMLGVLAVVKEAHGLVIEGL